jgi:hypothetical protein
MVDIYPVRYVVNYPGQPIEVTIKGGALSGYSSGYLTIATVSPGATIYVATLTTHAEVNIIYSIQGVAPNQTVYLNVEYGNKIYSFILNPGAIAGYIYEQSLVLPAGSTIGLSFSNTSEITVVYGAIY